MAAAVFAALYFANEPETKTVVEQPCGDRIFGHIDSLAKQGDHYELRFDPAWFTSGVTANTAAAEDGLVEPPVSRSRTTTTSWTTITGC